MKKAAKKNKKMAYFLTMSATIKSRGYPDYINEMNMFKCVLPEYRLVLQNKLNQFLQQIIVETISQKCLLRQSCMHIRNFKSVDRDSFCDHSSSDQLI